MVNKEIVEYIKKAKSEGLSDETIKNNLISVGWKESDINEAHIMTDGLEIPRPPTVPPVPENTTQTQVTKVRTDHTMWDVFENILMFISLYVMATSLAFLLHGFTDNWFPKAVEDYYYSESFYSSIVLGSLAALIVSFPLFSFLFLDVTKRTNNNPQLRGLIARKFFIYVTLFVTFLILLYKTITTVYDLLSGNISVNFLLHFIITIGVTGTIFVYYISQIKGDRKLNV